MTNIAIEHRYTYPYGLFKTRDQVLLVVLLRVHVPPEGIGFTFRIKAALVEAYPAPLTVSSIFRIAPDAILLMPNDRVLCP